jgi:hypothetical protein
MAPTERRLHSQQQALAEAQIHLSDAHRQAQERRRILAGLEQAYQARQRRVLSPVAKRITRWAPSLTADRTAEWAAIR